MNIAYKTVLRHGEDLPIGDIFTVLTVALVLTLSKSAPGLMMVIITEEAVSSMINLLKMEEHLSVKPIPISAAKKISKDSNYPEIVIFAYDPESGMQHVTTYGATVEQCKDAAKAGNYLKKALGWPE